jgi:heme exporter protein D
MSGDFHLGVGPGCVYLGLVCLPHQSPTAGVALAAVLLKTGGMGTAFYAWVLTGMILIVAIVDEVWNAVHPQTKERLAQQRKRQAQREREWEGGRKDLGLPD